MSKQIEKFAKGQERKKRIVLPFRSVLKWLVRLRRSPRAIAGGFALGTFIAFTPTIGFQIGLVILLATAFNLNRPAAIVTVWITNVATMAPIYTFNYWVGSFIWSGPNVSEVYKAFVAITLQLMKMDIWEIKRQFSTVLSLSTEIVIPLTIGSLIVGLIASILVYLLSLSLIYTILVKRVKKQKLTSR
jgi:uncharacterized protein (DUF2062 family)